MKKLFVFTLVFLTVSVAAHAMIVSQQWDKTYSIPSGFGHEEVVDISQTTDGGYIIAGFNAGFDAINIWVIKLDSSGNVLWEKSYGGSNDRATSIQQTIDGGYIIATLYGDILKIDSSGNIIWQNSYNFWDAAIQQISDGGYIVTGSIESLGGNDNDIAVTKLDSNGAVIWQKTYGGSSHDGPRVALITVPITQTTDSGYIFATGTFSFGAGSMDALVVKLDSEGTILWQKTYGGIEDETAFSIQESSAGGYIVAGTTYSFGAGEDDAWILRLDNAGNAIWQKVYGGYSWDFAKSIQQTTDGNYVFVGGGNSFSSTDGLWVVKLDIFGNIIWQNTYTERRSGNNAVIQQTIDEGYIVGTNSAGDFEPWDIWVLKLDNYGEIPDCNVMASTNASVANTNVSGQNSDAIAMENSVTPSPIYLDVQNTSASISTLCNYVDPNDMDGDGVENTPGGTMASSMFLAGEDNCPDMPNGPFLGTCTAGATYKIGRPCINDSECGSMGLCSMNQEDSNADGIGDACYLCECDFNCDGNVDATDVISFLTDFGRSQHNDPCTNQNSCSGDVDCNGAVDANDVVKFIEDFGRNQFSNSCPACEVGDWCVYP